MSEGKAIVGMVIGFVLIVFLLQFPFFQGTVVVEKKHSVEYYAVRNPGTVDLLQSGKRYAVDVSSNNITGFENFHSGDTLITKCNVVQWLFCGYE